MTMPVFDAAVAGHQWHAHHSYLDKTQYLRLCVCMLLTGVGAFGAAVGICKAKSSRVSEIQCTNSGTQCQKTLLDPQVT
jgi:hypothetical protein